VSGLLVWLLSRLLFKALASGVSRKNAHQACRDSDVTRTWRANSCAGGCGREAQGQDPVLGLGLVVWGLELGFGVLILRFGVWGSGVQGLESIFQGLTDKTDKVFRGQCFDRGH